MLEHTEAILEQALLLSPKDRATLVGKLLASLDQPDASTLMRATLAPVKRGVRVTISIDP
jgi:hypothetical protein